MPTVDLPGMRSISTDSACIARQRSSARPVILRVLHAGVGLELERRDDRARDESGRRCLRRRTRGTSLRAAARRPSARARRSCARPSARRAARAAAACSRPCAARPAPSPSAPDRQRQRRRRHRAPSAACGGANGFGAAERPAPRPARRLRRSVGALARGASPAALRRRAAVRRPSAIVGAPATRLLRVLRDDFAALLARAAALRASRGTRRACARRASLRGARSARRRSGRTRTASTG